MPALGLWHFTGTNRYQSFDEDGQLTANTTRAIDYDKGYSYNTAGAPITPGYNAIEYIAYQYYRSGTKNIGSRAFVENSSLTVKVPKNTTHCWFYLTATCSGVSKACVRLLQATVDT